MTDVPATYFDRQMTAPRAVRLRWNAFDGELDVRGDGIQLRFSRRDFTLEPRLGRDPRVIRFADGSRCEVPPEPGADEIIASWPSVASAPRRNAVPMIWGTLAAILLLLIALGWAIVHYALPWGARRIAFALPADITKQLAEQTLASLDRSTLRPTTLTHERRLALQQQFSRFLAQTGDTAPYRLEFRSAPETGPNAFALPYGIIVLTDELVQLAEDDRELIAVLAHECGHIAQRHALRGILQKSGVLVGVALITGDVSSASSLGTALPAYLLETGFSRDFEREADAHAVAKLDAADIEPRFLAQMLERLAQHSRERSSALLGYLQTHPPTRERIETISGKR